MSVLQPPHLYTAPKPAVLDASESLARVCARLQLRATFIEKRILPQPFTQPDPHFTRDALAQELEYIHLLSAAVVQPVVQLPLDLTAASGLVQSLSSTLPPLSEPHADLLARVLVPGADVGGLTADSKEMRVAYFAEVAESYGAGDELMRQARVAQPASAEEFSVALTASIVDDRTLFGVDYTFEKPGEVDAAPLVSAKEAQQIKAEVLAALNAAGKKAKGDLKINSLNLAGVRHSVLKRPDLDVSLLLVLGNAARSDRESHREDAQHVLDMLEAAASIPTSDLSPLRIVKGAVMGDDNILSIRFGYESEDHQVITVTIAITYFASAGVASLALNSSVAFWQSLKRAAHAISLRLMPSRLSRIDRLTGSETVISCKDTEAVHQALGIARTNGSGPHVSSTRFVGLGGRLTVDFLGRPLSLSHYVDPSGLLFGTANSFDPAGTRQMPTIVRSTRYITLKGLKEEASKTPVKKATRGGGKRSGDTTPQTGANTASTSSTRRSTRSAQRASGSSSRSTGQSAPAAASTASADVPSQARKGAKQPKSVKSTKPPPKPRAKILVDTTTTGTAPLGPTLDTSTSTTAAGPASSDTDVEMESQDEGGSVRDSSTGAAASPSPSDAAKANAEAWQQANALPRGTAERALARRELVHGWHGVPKSPSELIPFMTRQWEERQAKAPSSPPGSGATTPTRNLTTAGSGARTRRQARVAKPLPRQPPSAKTTAAASTTATASTTASAKKKASAPRPYTITDDVRRNLKPSSDPSCAYFKAEPTEVSGHGDCMVDAIAENSLRAGRVAATLLRERFAEALPILYPGPLFYHSNTLANEALPNFDGNITVEAVVESLASDKVPSELLPSWLQRLEQCKKYDSREYRTRWEDLVTELGSEGVWLDVRDAQLLATIIGSDIVVLNYGAADNKVIRPDNSVLRVSVFRDRRREIEHDATLWARIQPYLFLENQRVEPGRPILLVYNGQTHFEANPLNTGVGLVALWVYENLALVTNTDVLREYSRRHHIPDGDAVVLRRENMPELAAIAAWLAPEATGEGADAAETNDDDARMSEDAASAAAGESDDAVMSDSADGHRGGLLRRRGSGGSTALTTVSTATASADAVSATASGSADASQPPASLSASAPTTNVARPELTALSALGGATAASDPHTNLATRTNRSDEQEPLSDQLERTHL